MPPIKNPQDPSPEPGPIEKGFRMGCGAIFGVVVGFLAILALAVTSFGLRCAVIAFAALVFGYASLKYGAQFWTGLIEIFLDD
jgi:hypothetical protein